MDYPSADSDWTGETPEPEEVEGAAETSSRDSGSFAWTLIAFITCLLLLRFIMPGLVEEVHYAIERGKQRARYDLAENQLSKVSHSDLSAVSQLVTQRIAPSVVHIDTRRESVTENEGQGSGVIISDDGQIITNFHVINEAESVEVTLADDRSFDATVIGVDPETDLALLKIDGVSNLIAAEWGDSDELETGSMVWAFGSPFGLSKSATFGIISAKERRSVDPRNAANDPQVYLQSDATVHAGNSGGPLVNSQGQVVGINTAIIGPSFLGVSFSIPANRARDVYDDALTADVDQRGWLGVVLTQPPRGVAGVMVEDFVVPTESPGKSAGLTKGDIITQWDGHPIRSRATLQRFVSEASVSEVVSLHVRSADDPAERQIDVKIGARPLQF